MEVPVPEAMARYGAHGVVASVIVITYNHEPFIAAALESVLAQQVTFAVELIVSEDCSTDGTRAVLEDFQRRYPDVVRLAYSERNLNTNDVTTRALCMARGRYIAVFDGDDFWTSPHKLQAQVAHMQRHPECAVSYHDAWVTFDAGDRPDERYLASEPPPFSGMAELTLGNLMPSSAVLYRADPLPEIPDWYRDLPLGDWPLHILFAQHGQIAYLPEQWSAYRVHRGGYWSQSYRTNVSEEVVRPLLAMDDLLDAYLKGHYARQFRHVRAYHWSLLIRGVGRDVPFGTRLRRLAVYYRIVGFRRALARRATVELTVQALSPGLYEWQRKTRRVLKRASGRLLGALPAR